MPQRIFKRKSGGKSTRSAELNTDGNRIESSTFSSPTNDGTSQKTEATIPNRIFIGGIPTNANEWDIRSKFANYGNVRAVKIIRDETGISRGYGFVTFNTDEEAKGVLEKVVFLKGRKLNIAPAIKKQSCRSELQSCESTTDSRSDSTTEEPCKNTNGNSSFSKFLEHPCEVRSSMTSESVTCSSEVPLFLDGGAFAGTPDFYRSYGNPHVNCLLTYPTVIYVPQQPYQCTAPGMACPMGAIPEMVQFVAAPPVPFCISPDSK